MHFQSGYQAAPASNGTESPQPRVESSHHEPLRHIPHGYMEMGPIRRHLLLLPWKWEIAGLGLSAGLIAAIIAILAHFDKHQLPQWPFSFNLSTLISVLSTILRAATLFAVAEVISQVKWSWFTEPRYLADLDRFDKASRGAMGSMQLLLHAPRDAIAITAAFVMVASLAIGPFAQQAIKTVPCDHLVPNTHAIMPAANFLEGEYSRIAAGTWDPLMDMKAALINALANPLGNDSAVPVICPTGNCTFPEFAGVTYSTIGLCSSCIDTTPKILAIGSDYKTANFTLPNGLHVDWAEDSNLNVGPRVDNFSWATSLFSPDFAAVIPMSLVNVSVLSLTTEACNGGSTFKDCANTVTGIIGLKMRPLAVSCALYPCLKNFHGSVVNGQVNETLVSTSPASTLLDLPETNSAALNFTALKTPCLVDAKAYDGTNFSTLTGNHSSSVVIIGGKHISAPLECLYKWSGIYARTMSSYISGSLLTGTCAGQADSPGVLHCPSQFWLEPLFASGSANLQSVSGVMDKFATAVTTKIRRMGTSLYATSSGTLARADAVGSVYSTTVCTEFSWAWLLLPIVVLVSAVLLLILTIVRNLDERKPVWKSSLLPLMFHMWAQPTATMSDTTTTMNKDRIEDTCGKVYAQVRKDGSGAVLLRTSHANDLMRPEEDSHLMGTK